MPVGITDLLKTTNKHVVILFGAFQSGKSLFLCSLFSHARYGRIPGFRGDTAETAFLPPDFENAAMRNRAVIDFWFSVREFQGGIAPFATELKAPLYLPFTLGGVSDPHPTSSRSAEFLFVETMGEWIGFDDL